MAGIKSPLARLICCRIAHGRSGRACRTRVAIGPDFELFGNTELAHGLLIVLPPSSATAGTALAHELLYSLADELNPFLQEVRYGNFRRPRIWRLGAFGAANEPDVNDDR